MRSLCVASIGGSAKWSVQVAAVCEGDSETGFVPFAIAHVLWHDKLKLCFFQGKKRMLIVNPNTSPSLAIVLPKGSNALRSFTKFVLPTWRSIFKDLVGFLAISIKISICEFYDFDTNRTLDVTILVSSRFLRQSSKPYPNPAFP